MTAKKFRGMLAAALSAALLAAAAPAVLADNTATPDEAQQKTVSAPGAKIETREDTITLTIEGEAGLAIYADLSGDLRMDLRAGDEVVFSGLAGGKYELEVDYHDVQPGVTAFRTNISVAGKPVEETPTPTPTPTVEPTPTPTPEPTPTPVEETPAPVADTNPQDESGDEEEAVAAPGASVSVEGDTVSVTVSGQAGLELYAFLGEDVQEHLLSGDTAVFSGLAAGEYELEVDYQEPQGVTPYRTTVTVQAAESGEGGSSGDDSSDEDDNTSETVPPTTDGGESTGGESSGSQSAAAASQFELNLSQKDGVITAEISGASDREVEVMLMLEGQMLETKSLLGNGSVSFSKQAAGVYTVYCDYVTKADGIWPGQKIIEIPSSSSGGTTQPEKTPTVMQIAAEVEHGENWIEVKVTGADSWPLYVAVGYESKTVNVGETARFENLAAGDYEIEVDYIDPVQGVSPFRSVVTLTKPVAKEISFSATGGVGRIETVVSDASTLPVTVRVLLGGAEVARKEIAGGLGKAVFEGLAAGEYTVAVNYSTAQSGISEKTLSGVIVTGKVQGIMIKSVTPGENKLTVSGTAQPNTDIALVTTPATSTVIVRSDSLGSFTAEITCPAGTYTQVKAAYVADNTVAATASGTYAVTAPAEKPSLTVDPIYTSSLKVVARSEPGVKVNLRIKEYNYGTTQIADSDGLLKFSLPMTYKKGTVVTFTVYYGADNALSYQQTVTIKKTPDYTVLSYGDTGSAVKELTDRLEELGYLADDTTRYSSAVREAVKLFQEINGLAVDGIAGEQTQKALYSVAAIPYGKGTIYPTLVRGDRNMALINKLQQRLKDLGYYTLRVDSIFGSGTQRAVRDFQRVNGLTVTGKADHATQQLLYSSSAKAADSSVLGDYDTLYRSKYYQSAVVPMQRRLKQLGYLAGSIDGYFGSQTQRAVRNFQRRNGLSVTGIADEQTQRLLYSSSAKAASGSSASSSTTGSYRLLYWGCEGSDVKRLQNALLSAGYSQVRVADGIYGQWTYDAVRAFQKDKGLSVDGIAGKNTQNALYGTSY